MLSQNKINKLSHSALVLRRSPLAIAVLLGIYASCVVTPVYAMESIDDQTMSDTTGADGLAINVQATQATAASVYWQDPTTSATTGNSLQLQSFSITNNVGSSTPFNMSATINAGSTGTTPALSLNLNVNTPTLFTAQSLVLCNDATTSSCSAVATSPSGAVQLLNGNNLPNSKVNGVTFTNPLSASLVTTNGLLNSQGTATVKLLLNNGNIFFTSNNTQLVTSDIYANISATGRIWVDATDGFRFSTSGPNVTNGGVILTSPYSSDTGPWNGSAPINAGLQYSLVMQTYAGTNAQAGVSQNQLQTTANGMGYTTSGSGLTFGVSGRLPQLDLTMRGSTAASMTADGVGGTTSVGGTVGSVIGNANGGNAIAMNMTGMIENASDPDAVSNPNNAFKLYFGSSGQYGYGIQMTNFVPFWNVKSTANPSFTSGNVYVNLLTSTTKQLVMPIPNVFAGGTASTATSGNTANYFNSGLAGETQGVLSDSTQVQDLQTVSVPATGGSLFFAIRGLSIQGVPLVTNFYQNGVGVCTGAISCSTSSTLVPNFSVMPVINNLNTNITLNAASAADITAKGGSQFPGLTQALNYSFAISIAGNNGGTETTSNTPPTTPLQQSALLLVDTSSNQYIGLRDVNLYLKADGLVVFTGDNTKNTNSFNLTLPNFMLVAQMGLAAGYLPGAEPAKGSNPQQNLFTSLSPSGSPLDTAMTFRLGLTSDLTNNQNNVLSFTDNPYVKVGSNVTTPNNMTFGLKLSLAGTPTAVAAALGAVPDQTKAGGNFFRIVDNSGSALGWDNITGNLAASIQLIPGSTLTNYNLSTPSQSQINSATINTTLQVNPTNYAGGEMLTTLNFYPSTSGGTAQTIGKMVLTGGTIISNMTLTPITH